MKLSIVIPAYNEEENIVRTLKTTLRVISKFHKDFEIVVVDDGQEKRADVVLKDFADSRIKYIQNQKSLGGAGARNTGIKNSQGEFIAFLDDDDEWLPTKLDKQVKALEDCDNSVVLVFSGFYAYDKEGKLVKTFLPNEQGIIWPFERVLHRAFIWTSTIMFRQKVVKQGIMFDETLKKNQEWDLTLRLLKIGKFFAINEPLVKLHILAEDEHLGGMDNIDNITSAFKLFINKHYVDYKKHKKSLAFCYLRLATLYKNNHQLKEARKYLFKAWLTRPWNLIYLYYILKLILKIIIK